MMKTFYNSSTEKQSWKKHPISANNINFQNTNVMRGLATDKSYSSFKTSTLSSLNFIGKSFTRRIETANSGKFYPGSGFFENFPLMIAGKSMLLNQRNPSSGIYSSQSRNIVVIKEDNIFRPEQRSISSKEFENGFKTGDSNTMIKGLTNKYYDGFTPQFIRKNQGIIKGEAFAKKPEERSQKISYLPTKKAFTPKTSLKNKYEPKHATHKKEKDDASKKSEIPSVFQPNTQNYLKRPTETPLISLKITDDSMHGESKLLPLAQQTENKNEKQIKSTASENQIKHPDKYIGISKLKIEQVGDLIIETKEKEYLNKNEREKEFQNEHLANNPIIVSDDEKGRILVNSSQYPNKLAIKSQKNNDFKTNSEINNKNLVPGNIFLDNKTISTSHTTRSSRTARVKNMPQIVKDQLDKEGLTIAICEKHDLKPLNSENYEFVETLGEGNYGSVSKMLKKNNKTQDYSIVAIKRVKVGAIGKQIKIFRENNNLTEDEKDQLEELIDKRNGLIASFFAEKDVLEHLSKSPNFPDSIPEYFGAFYELEKENSENVENLILVTESGDLDLQNILKERIALYKYYSAEEALNFLASIIQAYKFLQINRVYHSDTKLDNIVYSKKKQSYLLVDFGASKIIPSSEILPTNDCEVAVVDYIYIGTNSYFSPEKKLKFEFDDNNTTEYYSKLIKFSPFRCDIWSLGICIIWMMGNIELQSESLIKQVSDKMLENQWEKRTNAIEIYEFLKNNKIYPPKDFQTVEAEFITHFEEKKSVEDVIRIYEVFKNANKWKDAYETIFKEYIKVEILGNEVSNIKNLNEANLDLSLKVCDRYIESLQKIEIHDDKDELKAKMTKDKINKLLKQKVCEKLKLEYKYKILRGSEFKFEEHHLGICDKLSKIMIIKNFKDFLLLVEALLDLKDYTELDNIKSQRKKISEILLNRQRMRMVSNGFSGNQEGSAAPVKKILREFDIEDTGTRKVKAKISKIK